MSQLRPGTLLHGGQYRITSVLGQGSFGITYLGMHLGLSKKVCIKEFFMHEISTRTTGGEITGMTEGTLQAAYGKKFQKEAINLASMEHPNIVRVTDYFEENSTYYYVMEYIEGENLNDYISKHRLTPKESIEMIKDIAKALQYMHEEQKMLHLDIKPGNVMRRASDGHLFLIDFGLSKHYDANGSAEGSTSIGLGTPGYAPLEQSHAGKDGFFQVTLDIYALGATLYKLLTGSTPPSCSDILDNEHLLDDELSKVGVTTDLCNVVKHAMCQKVSGRTQTVRDFIKELNNVDLTDVEVVIDSEKTQFEVVTPGRPTDQPTGNNGNKIATVVNQPKEKKHNYLIWILVAVLILGVGAGAGYMISQQNSKSTNIGDDEDDEDEEEDDTPTAGTEDNPLYLTEDELNSSTNGYCVITFSDCTYTGYITDGTFNGNGKLEWNNGDSFEGNFVNDMKTGYGVWIFPENLGTRYMYEYEGNFENNNYNGEGTAYYGDGTYETGTWKDDILQDVTESGTWDTSQVQ